MARRSARSIALIVLAVFSAGCAGERLPPTQPPPTPPPTATVATPAALPTSTPTPTPPPTPTPLPPTAASPLTPWQPLPTDGLPGPWINDVWFATPTTVFIVADGDVYRSDDSGTTWTLSLSTYRGMRSVAASPAYAADRTVFAADGRSILLRSTDGGETWEELAQIAPVGGASDADVYLSISPAYPADPTLWAVVEGGVAFRSTDGGLTWEEFDPGFALPPMTRLMPNPNYPDDPSLEPVGPATYEGVDLPEGLPSPATALAESDGTLLVGTTRGLYRSTDAGGTWAAVNTGLPAAPAGAVAVAPDGALYASVGGDPRLFHLPPNGARWEPLSLLPGEPAVYGVSASAPPALVVTTDAGLAVSRDGGQTWTQAAGEGLPPADPYRLSPLPAADFAASGVAYLIYNGRIYHTGDGGDSWQEVEEVADVEALTETPDGRWIGLARDAVYERDPETGQWTSYPSRFDGAPATVRFVTDQLAVAVADGSLYLSQDGGRSWSLIGESSLDYASGYLISPRFDADRAIYARGATAIYVSTDAGLTWVEAVEGLPPCEYYDSPECDVVLLGAAPTETGYILYASVRHDFHTRIWAARTVATDCSK